MAKRARSPNYPAIGLPEALERLQILWDAIQRHPAPRELVATGMGYSGLHGASNSAVSALRKYGLLERVGTDLQVSERGMMYLHPQEPTERVSAIREAAAEPELFATLGERFPGGVVNEELIRNYLLRNNFTGAAAANAILAYRETIDLVIRETNQHSSTLQEAHRNVAEEADQMRPELRQPVSDTDDEPAAEVRAVTANRFLVSMNDEFFVDVNATRLDRSGVKKLIDWLQANQELVPEAAVTVLATGSDSEPAEEHEE